MKEYPSINARINRDIDIIAFNKLDGSNIRAEWSQKRGFYKFGSRKCIISEVDKHLGEAVKIIKAKYEKALDRIFRKANWQRDVVCFFEYYGANSFAGQHVEEPHDVVLLDVWPFKYGIIPPREFVSLFEDLGIPTILYKGRITREFEQLVRNSTLPGMSFEGVVCKAGNPNRKKTSHPIMFKIKSLRWLDRLKVLDPDSYTEETNESSGLIE